MPDALNGVCPRCVMAIEKEVKKEREEEVNAILDDDKDWPYSLVLRA
jgi:hypothetical protein